MSKKNISNIYDLRITSSSRKKLAYKDALFCSNSTPKDLFRQADNFALILNNSSNEKKYSGLNLYLISVLHCAYEDVITKKSENNNLFKNYFTKYLNNSEFKLKLKRFKTLLPSIIHSRELSFFDLRGELSYKVLTNNKAIMNEVGILFTLSKKENKEIFINISKNKRMRELISFLSIPSTLFPTSLIDQISYILSHWSEYLSDNLKLLIQNAFAYYREVNKPRFSGKGVSHTPSIKDLEGVEAYTQDKNWMGNVVLLAKNILVWLSQLSKKYNRNIQYLSDIPDEELDFISSCGFNALWLIGIWKRSYASKRIKQLSGNQDAESSAYSIYSYDIADNLGGYLAFTNLKERCEKKGIRLASDMVANHTGIDSPLVVSHPEYFINQTYSPFSTYTYNGEDLSSDTNIEIKIEDHYFDKTDCAVTFRRVDKRTGDVKYIFHGNDGTSMPWNDTAQFDYLNKETREEVVNTILKIASDFPIIRFDAAMTLTMRHIRRLWYPSLQTAGDIPGRADHTMSDEEFMSKVEGEFWRYVVDTVQEKAPNTLLLAEAFWMLEGYFVRSLGMHRVYNSAFMNMLRNENNKEYRRGIKDCLEFDSEIMKRYVNFLNNPDEEPAIVGFGDSDKYIGCCTLLATLPGLVMFGHGQIEGFYEKYGMEYSSPKLQENINKNLLEKHKKYIFPLLKKRYIFSGVENFQLYDMIDNGTVQENVYAYSNSYNSEKSIVIYNNSYSRAKGYIKVSSLKKNKATSYNEEKCISDILGANNTFMCYQTLSDNLWHIYPKELIDNEGIFFALDGFESMVMWNIHFVGDEHGVLKNYWDIYKTKGSIDINEEAEDLYFNSIYKNSSAFTDPVFQNAVSNLLTKTKNDDLKIIKEVSGEGGVKIFENVKNIRKVSQDFSLSLYSVLPHSTQVFEMLLFIIKNFTDEDIFNKKELIVRCASRFFTYQFKKEDKSIDKYAKKQAEECVLTIIEAKEMFIKYGIDNSDLLNNSLLLQNETFCNKIYKNIYDGIEWYNKELFQRNLVLYYLSFILFNKCSPKEIDSLFKRLCFGLFATHNTGYKFLKLLEAVKNSGGDNEV